MAEERSNLSKTCIGGGYTAADREREELWDANEEQMQREANNGAGKHIIAFQGYIACGKSTISTKLADHMGVPRLETKNIDISVRDRYSKSNRYEKLIELAAAELSKDDCTILILDGTFSKMKYMNMVLDLKNEYDTDLTIVRCYCDSDEEILKRIDKRDEPFSENAFCFKSKILNQHPNRSEHGHISGEYDMLSYLIPANIITVDTNPGDMNQGVEIFRNRTHFTAKVSESLKVIS